MRTPFSILALAAITGCGPAAYTYSGYWASDHFPLTPAVWTYTNEGDDVDYMMEVSIIDTEQVDGTDIATFDYVNTDDNNALLYSIKWASDNYSGIQIHGYRLADGSWVNFSQPLQVVDRQGEPNSSIESNVDGYAYTTTFEAYEDCPNMWTENWQCMKVVITSEETNMAPFLGTWHWATEFGTSLFQPEGAEFPWKLTSHDWISAD